MTGASCLVLDIYDCVAQANGPLQFIDVAARVVLHTATSTALWQNQVEGPSSGGPWFPMSGFLASL